MRERRKKESSHSCHDGCGHDSAIVVQQGHNHTEHCKSESASVPATRKHFKLVDAVLYKQKPVTCCPICKIFMNEFPNSLNVEDYEPSRIEELANILTHSIPMVIFIYLFFSNDHVVNSVEERVSSILYCFTLFTLFFISTSYHVMCLIYGKFSHKTYWFRIVDYATIYIFIAATYTPFLMILEIGSDNMFGRFLTVFVWCLAFCGLTKSFSEGRMLNFISNGALFNIMGWVALVAMPSSMFIHVPLEAYFALFGGGFFFSGGIFFLNSDGIIPFSHAIWHLFSVGGILLHFICIYFYIFQLDDHFHPQSNPHNSKVVWQQIVDTFNGERTLFGHLRS